MGAAESREKLQEKHMKHFKYVTHRYKRMGTYDNSNRKLPSDLF